MQGTASEQATAKTTPAFSQCKVAARALSVVCPATIKGSCTFGLLVKPNCFRWLNDTAKSQSCERVWPIGLRHICCLLLAAPKQMQSQSPSSLSVQCYKTMTYPPTPLGKSRGNLKASNPVCASSNGCRVSLCLSILKWTNRLSCCVSSEQLAFSLKRVIWTVATSQGRSSLAKPRRDHQTSRSQRPNLTRERIREKFCLEISLAVDFV